jgi:Kef-type K+ transport system membrane component KefB
MLVGAVGLFLLINAYGSQLAAQAAARTPATPPVGGKPDALIHVLIALGSVIVTGRMLSVLFRRLGQPAVIGDVVAGILLGPSVLGWVWPEAGEFLLPAAVAPFLGVIAQLGVILYMFVVGLELNPSLLRERAQATVAISHSSIVVPLVLGSGLALILHPRLSTSEVNFTSFALFVGVALSITAFPVLARILTDRKRQNTQLGIIALGCAATDDVTAWCLLAFVVGVAQAQLGGALLVLGMTVAYIAFMVLLVRPIARHFACRAG